MTNGTRKQENGVKRKNVFANKHIWWWCDDNDSDGGVDDDGDDDDEKTTKNNINNNINNDEKIEAIMEYGVGEINGERYARTW